MKKSKGDTILMPPNNNLFERIVSHPFGSSYFVFGWKKRWAASANKPERKAAIQ